MADADIILNEDFSQGMDNWWAEGGERVWVEDGRLHVRANPPAGGEGGVATVWCRQPMPGDVQIEFDAHVIASRNDYNNINFFFCYSMPDGRDLFATRDERANGAYAHYKQFTGYIVTFLNDTNGEGDPAPDGGRQARLRMRRCPGFNLVDETFAYHCRGGNTYHVVVTKRGGRLTYAVDGAEYVGWTDPEPLTGGLLGLRTYLTYLWWDNIVVRRLPAE